MNSVKELVVIFLVRKMVSAPHAYDIVISQIVIFFIEDDFAFIYRLLTPMPPLNNVIAPMPQTPLNRPAMRK